MCQLVEAPTVRVIAVAAALTVTQVVTAKPDQKEPGGKVRRLTVIDNKPFFLRYALLAPHIICHFNDN